MNFFIFLFIIFIVFWNLSYVIAPPDNSLVIRRNGNYYMTLKPNESMFINPFTDTYEIGKASDSTKTKTMEKYYNFDSSKKVIVPDNVSNTSSSRSIIVGNSKTSSHSSFKQAIPVFTLDKQSKTIFVKGSYTLNPGATIKNSFTINDLISKIVRTYYSKVNFSTSPIELNKNELNILDLLREKLKPVGISLNSFDMSLQENTNFNKVDCTHYPTKTKTTKKTNYYDDDYSSGDSIVTYADETYSNNPIRESSSITSILHNTLDNMDSNVDPIDNKF